MLFSKVLRASICLSFGLAGSLISQTTPNAASATVLRRDPEAISTITAYLRASSSGFEIGNIQGFEQIGSITHYWGPERVTTETVRALGRATDSFKLHLGGQSEWYVSKGTGRYKSANNEVSEIPFHNATTLGAFTFPLLRAYAGLSSPTTELIDLGTETINGVVLHGVRLRPLLPSPTNLDNRLSNLASADLFFNPETHRLELVRDNTHPLNTLNIDIPRTMEFSDYRTQDGITMPFEVSQRLQGQLLWTMKFTEVRINPTLLDSDLAF